MTDKRIRAWFCVMGLVSAIVAGLVWYVALAYGVGEALWDLATGQRGRYS